MTRLSLAQLRNAFADETLYNDMLILALEMETVQFVSGDKTYLDIVEHCAIEKLELPYYLQDRARPYYDYLRNYYDQYQLQ